MEQEFEDYWKAHRASLIAAAPQPLREERENSGKMNTAGDWLLFIVPIAVVVWFSDHGFFAREIANFLVALALGILTFALATLAKPYITGKRNVVDIDADIKAHFHAVYKEKGVKGLEAARA